jgi:hypothetical protein
LRNIASNGKQFPHEGFAAVGILILLLRPDKHPHRFHTASVIRAI